MRITKIEAIPYAPPLRNFFGSGVKLGFGELKNIQFGLVKIHTNQNIFGIGEISNVFSPNGGEQCRKVKDILQPMIQNCLVQQSCRYNLNLCIFNRNKTLPR